MIKTKKPHSLNVSSFFMIFCSALISFFGAKSAGIQKDRKMIINAHKSNDVGMVIIENIVRK